MRIEGVYPPRKAADGLPSDAPVRRWPIARIRCLYTGLVTLWHEQAQ